MTDCRPLRPDRDYAVREQEGGRPPQARAAYPTLCDLEYFKLTHYRSSEPGEYLNAQPSPALCEGMSQFVPIADPVPGGRRAAPLSGLPAAHGPSQTTPTSTRFVSVNFDKVEALEAFAKEPHPRVIISSAPLVEGAVIAAVEASIGNSLQEVAEAAADGATLPKVHDRNEEEKDY